MLNFLFFSPYLLLPPPTVALAGLSANRIGDFPTVYSKEPETLSLGTGKTYSSSKSFHSLAAQLELSSLGIC